MPVEAALLKHHNVVLCEAVADKIEQGKVDVRLIAGVSSAE